LSRSFAKTTSSPATPERWNARSTARLAHVGASSSPSADSSVSIHHHYYTTPTDLCRSVGFLLARDICSHRHALSFSTVDARARRLHGVGCPPACAQRPLCPLQQTHHRTGLHVQPRADGFARQRRLAAYAVAQDDSLLGRRLQRCDVSPQ